MKRSLQAEEEQAPSSKESAPVEASCQGQSPADPDTEPFAADHSGFMDVIYYLGLKHLRSSMK